MICKTSCPLDFTVAAMSEPETPWEPATSLFGFQTLPDSVSLSSSTFLKVCLPLLRCLISLLWPSSCKKKKKRIEKKEKKTGFVKLSTGRSSQKNNLLPWNNQRLDRAQTRKSGNFYSVLYITLRRISFLLSLRTSPSTLWQPQLCPPRASAH